MEKQLKNNGISTNGIIESLRSLNHQPFHRRLSDVVYDYVVEKIFENDFQQGQKITESDLANILNISTAPVREAMIKLAQEGWVIRTPNRGAYINNYKDPENYRRLYSLRLSLEIGSFYQLAQCIRDEQLIDLENIVKELETSTEQNQLYGYRHADTEFHLLVAQFAGGDRLKEALKPVLMQIFIIVYSKDMAPGDVKPSASHRALFESIAAHDVTKAAHLITEHIHSQASKHGIEI